LKAKEKCEEKTSSRTLSQLHKETGLSGLLPLLNKARRELPKMTKTGALTGFERRKKVHLLEH